MITKMVKIETGSLKIQYGDRFNEKATAVTNCETAKAVGFKYF